MLTVITRSTLIAAFTSGVTMPIRIALAGESLLLSSATSVTRETMAMNVKKKKHKEIQLLAQTKLENIQDIISKALTDGHVLDFEFERILSELERYRTLKQELHHNSKKKVDITTDEQREAIPGQGREEGRNSFSRQLANTFAIQSANATLGMNNWHLSMIHRLTKPINHPLQLRNFHILLYLHQSLHDHSCSLNKAVINF